MESFSEYSDVVHNKLQTPQKIKNLNDIEKNSTPGLVKQQHSQSPGEDEFEEPNMSLEISPVRKQHQKKQDIEKWVEINDQDNYGNTKISNKQEDNIKEVKVEQNSNNQGEDSSFLNIVVRHFPPNPLLPKSFMIQQDSPKSGGACSFVKLLKFKGKDNGKSRMMGKPDQYSMINFPDKVTLKSIFLQDIDETPFGDLVFLRYKLDFQTKISMPGTKKDEVLEANLLDVKRLLKNSAVGGGQASKKGLVNLIGVEPYYTKKDKFDKTLIFESRFESGNLAAALKVNQNDYHLLLQNDVNTSGHTQWFFFRVQNTTQYETVRFNMLNLAKPDSLFNEGMKVLIFSEKFSEEKDIGWYRGGYNIGYYQNGIQKDSQKKSKSYYTMTFTYDFEYSDDTVFFAYTYPYTFTDLQEDLNKITNDPIKSQFCTKKVLCDTLAGNKCEVLTITSKLNLETLNQRKGVVLSARVHPGESVGSWMLKGAIEFLTDENSEEAEILRQNYVFKIIPMMNPDGVINGNYRCSLAGCDLNRRWKAPSKCLHPTIYYTKQLLQNFAKERDLAVYCDFHGHSRRKNIFMYGCHIPSAPEDTRFFPFLMSKICPFFMFNHSRFGTQKSKEATARVAMFKELKIPSIFTIESSFCGADAGPMANYHFSIDNLMQTGKDFCRTLLMYNAVSAPPNIIGSVMTSLMSLYSHYALENEAKSIIQKDQETEAMKQFVDKIDKYKEAGTNVTFKQIRKSLMQVLRTTQDLVIEGETSSSAGSEPAPSEDNLEIDEMEKVVPIEEDEDLKKLKKSKELMTQQEIATSISPLRRKTINESLHKRNSILKQPQKRMSILKNLQPTLLKDSKLDLLSSTNSQLKQSNSKQTTLEPNQTINEDNNEGEEELKQKAEMNEAQVMGVHKKKRKRNVESRDVWTQTDRSDYMLIKYRQKQKQAQQLVKKSFKDEQNISVVLGGTGGNQQIINTSSEQYGDIFNSSQPFNKISKVNKTPSNPNKTQHFPGQSGTIYMGAGTDSPLSQQNKVGGIINHSIIQNNNRSVAKTDLNQRKANPILQSRNQLQSQGNKLRSNMGQNHNRSSDQPRMLTNNFIPKTQHNHIVNPVYQSTDVTIQHIITPKQNLGQNQTLYQLKQQQVQDKNAKRIQISSDDYKVQGLRKLSHAQELREGAQNDNNQPQATSNNLYVDLNQTSHSPMKMKKKLLYENNYTNEKQSASNVKNKRDSQSELSGDGSANNLGVIKKNKQHQDKELQRVINNANDQEDKNMTYHPKSLPPKPQQVAQSNYSPIRVANRGAEELTQERSQLKNIRVLENTYIQQKLFQQQELQQNPTSSYKELYQNSNQKTRDKKSLKNINQNTTANANTSSNNQTIKKLLESSWRVQQQQLGQLVTGDESKVPYNQGIKMSAQGKRPRRNIDRQISGSQQPMSNTFMNIQSIGLAAGINSSSNSIYRKGGGGGVKISIVNVHNEFNFQNNIFVNEIGIEPSGLAQHQNKHRKNSTHIQQQQQQHHNQAYQQKQFNK